MNSLCPYCGVGCQLVWHVKDDRILRVEGRDGPANHARLCVKGRFGFDYVRHPNRLTAPLIRRPGVARRPEDLVDPADPSSHFREAGWDEALDVAARGFLRIREAHGGGALAGFGSAKGSNEEAWLVQKLVRTGFRTNNVDHCTRLCHASSIAALLESIGSGAVTAPVSEAANADVIVVAGANPVGNHPVAATFMKNAVRRGAKLIVVDPRGMALKRYASHMLQPAPGSDVALLNALIHVIVAERLYDEDYVRGPHRRFCRTRGPCRRLRAGSDGRTLRDPGPDAARSGAALRRGRPRDDLLGHGHIATCARDRQRPVASSRWRCSADMWGGRGRACIPCAARTMSRARPTPG